MAIDVTTAIEIRRPVAEVAAFVANPSNDLNWIGGIRTVKVLSGTSGTVGMRAARTAKFLGRSIHYVYEVVEAEPERVLAMRSVTGPFPMATRYTYEATPQGTRMRIRNAGGPGGPAGLAAPLMGWFVNRRVAADLRRLQRLLEST